MSGDQLDLNAIERIASEAASHHSGRRWVVDEESDNTDVRANLGAGPTVCTTIPLGYDIRRANAAHIASMDPATTLAMVAEVRRLRYALRDVRNALGPDRICDCPMSDGDCGLREEAGEALAIAREALGT